ncbi:MAG: TMEM175 family protein [Acidobacteriaceae bacterium]
MKNFRAAAPEEHSRHTAEQNRIGLERLMFFSDAVFAIAITVLILDIHLPEGGEAANDGELLSILVGLWHQYLAYVISFWVIGIYWINHHRKFLLIKKFDGLLLTLNLLLLMFIAFIPFPSAVISENTTRLASIFYSLVMASGGLALTILWLHAEKNNNLIDPRLSKQLRWRETAGSLAIAIIFLVSIGIAFINQGLIRIVWLLIIPISLFIQVRRDSP